jgi:hypothetical protein
VNRIVTFRQFASDADKLGPDQPKTAPLQSADGLADQAALDTIGLHKHERPFQDCLPDSLRISVVIVVQAEGLGRGLGV